MTESVGKTDAVAIFQLVSFARYVEISRCNVIRKGDLV